MPIYERFTEGFDTSDLKAAKPRKTECKRRPRSPSRISRGVPSRSAVPVSCRITQTAISRPRDANAP